MQSAQDLPVRGSTRQPQQDGVSVHDARMRSVAQLQTGPSGLSIVRATGEQAMIVKLKLTKKQVDAALRDFGNDRTGPFIARGCKCLACGMLRAVLRSIKQQTRKAR
jgi:hypothetical protein